MNVKAIKKAIDVFEEADKNGTQQCKGMYRKHGPEGNVVAYCALGLLTTKLSSEEVASLYDALPAPSGFTELNDYLDWTWRKFADHFASKLEAIGWNGTDNSSSGLPASV